MTMPWWGWLIAAVVLMICLTAVAVMVVMTRAMRHDVEDHAEWRARHGLGGAKGVDRCR